MAKQGTQQGVFEPTCRDHAKVFTDFRKDIETKFDRKPYIGEITKFRWDLGLSISEEEADDGWKRQDVFRKWSKENLLTPSGETDAEAIMIIPFGSDAPKYRDELNGCGAGMQHPGYRLLTEKACRSSDALQLCPRVLCSRPPSSSTGHTW